MLKFVLIMFICWDIGYSFYQHYHMSVGGDIAQVVVPTHSQGYYDVLNDPLGISVFTGEKSYSNPNRFFAHWAASKYLLYSPIVLQNFVSPISSIYLSIAIFKTILQLILILLLTTLITSGFKPFNLEFLISMAIITPLFQTWGYNRFMGIIDQSVIYSFFYALPMVAFLLYLVPINKWFHSSQQCNIKWGWIAFMLLISFPLALGGPLIPGVVMVCSFLFLVRAAIQFFMDTGTFLANIKKHQKDVIILGVVITWLSLLCLYSLYLGSQNTLNNPGEINFAARYARIPRGLWGLLSTKLGLPLVLIIILINFYLVKRLNFPKKSSFLKLSNWLLAFILLYILLLPLGGYREYRPNTVRYDTIIPVTLVLFYMLGRSSLLLLVQLKGFHKMLYGLLLLAITFIYSFSDTAKTEKFNCEYDALNMISKSEKDIVDLDNHCPVLEFRIVHEASHSELKAELLQKWNVTSKKKLFYQKKAVDSNFEN